MSLLNNNSLSAAGQQSPTTSFTADNFMTELGAICAAYGKSHGWVSIGICSVGTVMNLMNIVVLTRPSIVNPVNLLLTSIAVCDMSLMISQLSSVLYSRVFFQGCHLPQRWHFGWVLFENLHMQFSVWAHVTSLWLAVVLGVARFMTIQSGGVTIWTKNSFILKAIGVTSVLCAVASLPMFLYTKIVPVTVELAMQRNSVAACVGRLCCPKSANSTCLSLSRCLAEEHYGGRLFVLEETKLLGENVPLIIMWLAALVHKISPCILLTLFMGLLIATMVKAEKRRKRLLGNPQRVTNSEFAIDSRKRRSSRATTSDRTTAMLVTVVFIFVATELPQGLVLLMAATGAPPFQMVYAYMGDIFELLSMVNSSVNFILYCLMSQKFRRVFCDVFCCGKRRGNGEKTLVETTYNGRRDSEHLRSRQVSSGALNCCWGPNEDHRESLRDTLARETSESMTKSRGTRPMASFDHAKVAKRQSHQSVETEIDSFSCHRLIEV